MKVLIWIGYLTVADIITIFFDVLFDLIPTTDQTDIILVSFLWGIVFASIQTIAIFTAIKHCKKWDWHKITKKASNVGMSVSEYARQGLTETFIEKLDTLCKSVHVLQVKPLLKELRKQKKITKVQYRIFLNEYYEKK